jgi:hypothetical protein
MGGGSYKEEVYEQAKTTRSLTGQGDFAYSDSKPNTIHPDLDPIRINKKAFGKLESRDSVEHPESVPVVVCFDVTGSNVGNARVAQKKLNQLMNGLKKAIPDPQVAIWANDDWFGSNLKPEATQQLRGALQVSEFESDNRVDEWLRKLVLVGNGAGNGRESYDLALYAAGNKTILDSVEKRGKKGYLFMYSDENFPKSVDPVQIKDVFGDEIPSDISIEDLIAKAREFYNIYVLWPQGGYISSRDRAIELFGKEFVSELESPDDIVEAIVSRVQIDAEKEAALGMSAVEVTQ